jgi:hypothetical protein
MFLLVFTVVQIREGAALDIGVSGGAAGLGAEASSSIGSGGLSAGAGLSGGGNQTSANGSLGPSGIGGGVNAGAVGVSANAGAGSLGLSAGGGANSGASVGASVGPAGIGSALGVDVGSTSAAASAGIGVNGVSAGGSANGAVNGGGSLGSTGGAGHGSAGSVTSAVGLDRTGTPAPESGAAPSQHAPFDARTSGFLTSIAPAALSTSSLAGATVPRALLPVEKWLGDGGWFRSIYLLQPLRAKPGTSLSIVQSCRNALVSGSARYGATHIDVASAGRASRLRDGSLSAPVEARILFQRGSLVQVRQARVTCRINQAGRTTTIY